VFRLSADVDLSALGTTERYRHIPDNAATYLSFDYNVIPEPATLSLLGAGVLILLGVRRKFTC
jgi:hypothetical protein